MTSPIPPETNEQSTARLEDELLKEFDTFVGEFTEFVAFLAAADRTQQEKRDRFLKWQARATGLFNRCEQSVGTSSLLGAHRDAVWSTTKAETCLGALDSILMYHESCKLAETALKLPVKISDMVSPAAYASMQRMVKQRFPDHAAKYRDKFAEAGLPTLGFDEPAPPQTTVDRTRIDYENGQLRSIDGLRSADAKEVLTRQTSVKVGDSSALGAFSGGQVAIVAKELSEQAKVPKPDPGRTEGSKAWWEFKKSFIVIPATVLATLIAAVIMGQWLRTQKQAGAVAPSAGPSSHASASSSAVSR